MGKNYLNAEEKGNMLRLAALTVTLGEIIDTWANKRDKRILNKYMRTAKTYIEKAFAGVVRDLDVKEVALLMKQAQKQELVFMPKKEAERAREKLKKESDTMVLPWDQFATLVELGLASCSVCESIGDEVTGCKYRALLMEQDVQALNLEPAPGQCQYRVKGGTDE